MEGSRRRRWTDAAWRALALLVLPILGWFALPAAPAPRPARAGRAEPGAAARVAPGEVRPASTGAAAPGRARPAAAAGASSGPAIEGDVQDPDGKPAAGATVTCGQGDGELSAQTDEGGKFRFDAEAAGCSAIARKQGFGPSGAEALRGGSGNHLRLAPPTGIAGNVVDETGAPVMFFLIGVESFTPAGSTGADGGAPATKISLPVNDQEGAFAWTDLAPGRYDLVASAPQRPFVRVRGVEVAPGAVTRGVRVVSLPGVNVTGTIVDARTHEPITGAMVFTELGLEMGVAALPAVSAAGGAYTLEGASPTGFDLHVVHVGYDEHVSRGLRPPTGGGALRHDVALRRLGDPAPPPAP
jgi:hypothetical protein